VADLCDELGDLGRAPVPGAPERLFAEGGTDGVDPAPRAPVRGSARALDCR
jgi:hypothetical protein